MAARVRRKTVLVTVIATLLLSLELLTVNIHRAMGIGTIYIRSDGTIDPADAPIYRDGYVYTLCNNITADASGIVVEKDSVILDGAGYTLKGPGTGSEGWVGVDLTDRWYVTVRNMRIENFAYPVSISGWGSSDNEIVDNEMVGGNIQISYSEFNSIVDNVIIGGIGVVGAGYNDISGNMISVGCIWLIDSVGNLVSNNVIECDPSWWGAVILCPWHWNCSYNTISDNVIQNSWAGIWLWGLLGTGEYCASYNTFSGNTMVSNTYGILFDASPQLPAQFSHNTFYHNDFMNNVQQVGPPVEEANAWDNGYPSGGNFWSDYLDLDLESGPSQNLPGSDGIGDSPYIMSLYSVDRYPLIRPFNTNYIPYEAAELAKAVVGTHYAYGGKGWDKKDKRFVSEDEIIEGYYSYDPLKGNWNTKRPGLDCTGLVYWSYNKAYGAKIEFPKEIKPPKGKIEFAKYLNPVGIDGTADKMWRYFVDQSIRKEDLRPGDLLFFDWEIDGTVDHVAMYVGEYYYKGEIEHVRYDGIFDVVYPRGDQTGVDHYILPKKLSDLSKLEKQLQGYGRVIFPRIVDGDKYLKITGKSPVSLNVTNPDGFSTTRNSSFEDMDYLEYDVDEDGDLDEVVIALGGEVSDYLINVIPKPDANPTDTYTLEVSQGNTTAVVAQNVPVSEIPTQPYIVTSNETTVVPRLDAHDIGITKLDFSKISVGQNLPFQISVTLFNYGQFTETVTATAYANTTAIATLADITIESRDSQTIILMTDNLALDKGSYTISAHITPVTGETNTFDNTLAGDNLRVTLKGEVTGQTSIDPDQIVDVYDLRAVGIHFSHSPPDGHFHDTTEYTVCFNADVNSDNNINISDLVIVATYYGETDP